MSKTKIIAIAGEKGGIGKTTLTGILAYGIPYVYKKHNKEVPKILVLDLDQQINASQILGANLKDKTIFDALTDTYPINECIQHKKEFHIISGSSYLSNLNLRLLSEPSPEFILVEKLKDIIPNYDYVLIDTPPDLVSKLSLAGLTLADEVLLPITGNGDLFSVSSLLKTYQTINLIKSRTNPELKIKGLIRNKYNPRLKLSQQIDLRFEEIADQGDTKIFNSGIRDSVLIRESQVSASNPFENTKSKVIEDCIEFIEEFLEEENE